MFYSSGRQMLWQRRGDGGYATTCWPKTDERGYDVQLYSDHLFIGGRRFDSRQEALQWAKELRET